MNKKSSDIVFPDGACTETCLDFISFKRSIGQMFEGSCIYTLRNICRQMNDVRTDTPMLQKHTALSIARRKGDEAQGTQLNRIRILRELAKYMASMCLDAYILPGNFTQKYKYDFKPYIFGQEQIAAVLHVADNIGHNPITPYAHFMIPALLRVFFYCGLRSFEARSLKTKSVDLADGVLTIEKSKFNISRYVPMSESLTAYLRKYAETMNFDMSGDELFFPSPTRNVYDESALRARFRAIMAKAGIAAQSNGKLPRIHDARHTFILNSYKKLTGELGLDFYTALPIVAAYVGHTNIRDTERYIHLPEFDHSEIVSVGDSVMESCLPEVIFDAES